MAEQTLEQLLEEKRKADEAAAALAKKIEELQAASRNAALEDVKKTIAQYGFTAAELGIKTETAPKPAKPAAAKKEGDLRKPAAIYYNAQAKEGEKLVTSRRDKPEWLTDENKTKFAVLEIAEQIRLLKAAGKSGDIVTKREEWLAENPTETHSNPV